MYPWIVFLHVLGAFFFMLVHGASVVASAVAMAFGFAAFAMAGERAGTVGGISIAEAVTLYDFWALVMGLVLPVSLAVLIGATAVVSIRDAVFPAWFGWVSALIAFGLLTPVAYLVILLAVVWLLVVSIWLYARGRAAARQSAATDDIATGT